MYAQLVLRSGKHSGRTLTMQHRKILLGCAADCALRIRAHGVASHHCALFASGGTLAVRNLANHGKSYLNEEPIKGTRRLQPGDTLRIGPLTIEVQFDPAELARRVPAIGPPEEDEERRTGSLTATGDRADSPHSPPTRVVGVCRSREWISGSPSDAAAGALRQLGRRE